MKEKPSKTKAVSKNKKLTKEDILQQKIADPKYSNQLYSADTLVSLPGTLFAESMQQNYANNGLLVSIKKSLEKQLEVIQQAIDRQTASNDMHSLNLVEQHVNFVDQGLTKPATEEK